MLPVERCEKLATDPQTAQRRTSYWLIPIPASPRLRFQTTRMLPRPVQPFSPNIGNADEPHALMVVSVFPCFPAEPRVMSQATLFSSYHGSTGLSV